MRARAAFDDHQVVHRREESIRRADIGFDFDVEFRLELKAPIARAGTDPAGESLLGVALLEVHRIEWLRFVFADRQRDRFRLPAVIVDRRDADLPGTPRAIEDAYEALPAVDIQSRCREEQRHEHFVRRGCGDELHMQSIGAHFRMVEARYLDVVGSSLHFRFDPEVVIEASVVVVDDGTAVFTLQTAEGIQAPGRVYRQRTRFGDVYPEHIGIRPVVDTAGRLRVVDYARRCIDRVTMVVGRRRIDRGEMHAGVIGEESIEPAVDVYRTVVCRPS